MYKLISNINRKYRQSIKVSHVNCQSNFYIYKIPWNIYPQGTALVGVPFIFSFIVSTSSWADSVSDTIYKASILHEAAHRQRKDLEFFFITNLSIVFFALSLGYLISSNWVTLSTLLLWFVFFQKMASCAELLSDYLAAQWLDSSEVYCFMIDHLSYVNQTPLNASTLLHPSFEKRKKFVMHATEREIENVMKTYNFILYISLMLNFLTSLILGLIFFT